MEEVEEVVGQATVVQVSYEAVVSRCLQQQSVTWQYGYGAAHT